VVIIIAILVFAKTQNLLCFQNKYSPGLNSYFRASLSSWTKRNRGGGNNNAGNAKAYEGVATSPPPGDRLDAVDGKEVSGRSSSSTDEVDDHQPPPPRPPKGLNLRDYKSHSQLSEGEDVV
jgi:hypothetical protein